MKCVQCTNEHNGTETVCEGCVEDAMRLIEGCLGGRPTATQIYRMFDMGGCGISPLNQFRPRCERHVIKKGMHFQHLHISPWETTRGSWKNHVYETICEVLGVENDKVDFKLVCITDEKSRPPGQLAQSCPLLGSCSVSVVRRNIINNEVV